MKTSEFLKSAAVIVVILLVFGLAAFGLNFHTAPLIEANNAGAAFAPLLAVLPSGKNFQEFDPASKNLPENVLKAYEETNGAGFIFEVSATGYKSGLVIRVGIDAEGKVAGSNVVSSNETWGQETSLNGKYNGQTIDTLSLIIASGATANSATSIGYNKAIEGALAAHVLVSGGKLDPSVVFEGMIASLHTGMGRDGALKATVVEGSGNIVKGWKALNNSGAAYVITEGESAYLVIVNAMGAAKVYDEEKNDVTADHSALVTEALAAYGDIKTSISKGITNKIKKLFSEEAANSVKSVNFDTFGSSTLALEFTHNGETYYMLQSKPLFYHDAVMTANIFIDNDGKIFKVDIGTLYEEQEYIPNFNGTPDGYFDRFTGNTEGTFNGDDTIISGATLTSNAVRQAIIDAFNTFNSIKGGEQ